jgi:CBS domain containing-hemolysin-like protein
MTLLILSTLVVFLSTGICALAEAALYAVPRPWLRQLQANGQHAGFLLEQFKEKMDYPISAILIFDTILGVGGAAVAGAQAHALFGPDYVIWFSVGLAASLLIVSQIVPKIVGVVYAKPIARMFAVPIAVAIAALYPVVWLIERFTRFLKPDEPPQKASEEEVKQMARISAEEGSILRVEAELIQNSLELNDLRAEQIMTPRDQVMALPAEMTVRQAFTRFQYGAHSQIPIIAADDSDRWTGLVNSRDILTEMARDHFDVRLADIARTFHCVPASEPGHVLLDRFLKQRSGLFAVVDEDGRAVGVVSLPDVIEEIVGEEQEATSASKQSRKT